MQFFIRCKIILLTLLFLTFPTITFANAGIGGAFSYNASPSSAFFASFTAKSDVSPWTVFFNANLDENTITIFLDDWFINERVAEHLDYFVFWGMSFGATFEENEISAGTGARFGAGLDFFFFKRHLELFVQAAWNPYFGIKNEHWDYSAIIKPLTFPCTAGVRIWF